MSSITHSSGSQSMGPEWESSFTNMENDLGIYLSLMVTNYSRERSFSKRWRTGVF